MSLGNIEDKFCEQTSILYKMDLLLILNYLKIMWCIINFTTLSRAACYILVERLACVALPYS